LVVQIRLQSPTTDKRMLREGEILESVFLDKSEYVNGERRRVTSGKPVLGGILLKKERNEKDK
jgi:hypothetical protein